MKIRRYSPDDLKEIVQLFYDTVHSVNAKDYSEKQLNAWAPGAVDEQAWNVSFLEHDTRVAVEDGRIIGFADMDASGYLDRLYVHKDCQGKGVASALCDVLEQTAGADCFVVHASITIDDEFVVHDIKVIEGEKGLFIAMPSRKAADGEYRDIAHPINSTTRDRIQTLILDKYQEVMNETDAQEEAAEE